MHGKGQTSLFGYFALYSWRRNTTLCVLLAADNLSLFFAHRLGILLSQQETPDLPGAKKFAGCFLSGTWQRNSLSGARPSGTRQRKASDKAAFAGCRALGKFQPSAKIGLYRVPATRQNMAAGKGGRLDGGQLPSAFAGCHPTKNFFYFF